MYHETFRSEDENIKQNSSNQRKERRQKPRIISRKHSSTLSRLVRFRLVFRTVLKNLDALEKTVFVLSQEHRIKTNKSDAYCLRRRVSS